jgi:hypothetical protein
MANKHSQPIDSAVFVVIEDILNGCYDKDLSLIYNAITSREIVTRPNVPGSLIRVPIYR